MALGGDGITAKLTEEKVALVQKMIKLGLSDKAIGRALSTSATSIRSYRGTSDDEKSTSALSTEEKGALVEKSTSALSTEEKGALVEKSAPVGAKKSTSALLTEEKSAEKITFIGGRKHMVEETTEKEEDFVHTECGAKIRKGQKYCPGCGVELNWDNE